MLVGSSGGGLPVGEKKRYTIGVELITNPSVLFLGEFGLAIVLNWMWFATHHLQLWTDEPTSGLDSRSAAVVMRVIHRIAQSGRTVVATIHVSIGNVLYLCVAT